MAGFSLISLALLGSMEVVGEGGCPSAVEVAAKLSGTSARHRAVLTPMGERQLGLELLDEQGRRVASRELRAATCEGLREATVATLLAWEAALAPPPSSPRAPLVVGPPEGVPVPPTPSSVVVRLDGALVGAFSARLTGGLFVAALVGPREASWRVRLHARGELPLEQPSAPGVVSWVRPAIGLGATTELMPRPVRFELGAAFEAGLVHAWGRGYETNLKAQAFDPALTADARVGWSATDHLEVTVGLGVSLFLIRQALEIRGIDVNVVLPVAVGAVRVGISWER